MKVRRLAERVWVLSMKRRKWLIPVAVIGFVFAAIGAMLGIIASKGLGISTGRYLEAKNGSAMLVLDNSPIQMSNRTGRDLFANLNISSTFAAAEIKV